MVLVLLYSRLSTDQEYPIDIKPFNMRKNLEGSHELIIPHSHPNFTLSYPTMGLPVPGKPFNSTRVKNEELAAFDEAVDELFKPYNDTDC